MLTVINTNASGPGSLAQEITTANADNYATKTTIDFDIPTSDPGYNASTGTTPPGNNRRCARATRRPITP